MINLVIAVAKEFAEYLIRNFKKLLFSKNSKFNTQPINKVGFVTFENFLKPDQCKILRDKIDYYLTEGGTNVWQDDEKSDNRIYFAENLDASFKEILTNKDILDSLAQYTGITEPSSLILAAKINAVDGNIGSGGGWHRDSPYTHQFKAIIYLSDVDESNGPFQYIKHSNSKFDILLSYFRNIFTPGQYRFSEEEISDYLNKTGKSVTDLTARMGTLVLADTKGIHRGKPISEGSRYAIFCYFWNNSYPEHFKKYEQKNKL